MSDKIVVVNITGIQYDKDKEELIIVADGYKGPFSFNDEKIIFNVPKSEFCNIYEKIQIGQTSQTIKGYLVIKS